MSTPPLIAHSLAEAYFYLMATPCPDCGKGNLIGGDARGVAGEGGTDRITILATCKACGNRRALLFDLPHGLGTDAGGDLRVVNPSEKPSRIIDVAQWITLFRVITTAAATKSVDKAEARRLGLEAAMCLEEALKFYDDAENSLPPSDAFYYESSRQRFADHPEQFARQRLIELRAKLPSRTQMRNRIAADEQKKGWRWWRK